MPREPRVDGDYLPEGECFGEQFVGSAAGDVIKGGREDHRLLRPIEFNQLIDSSFDSRWGADNRTARAADGI